MLIAVPAETSDGLASTRSGHFGHAPWFTLVTVDEGEVVRVQSVKSVDHDEVGCGGVIDFVASLGIDAIITAGMGVPPFTRFTNAGVKVYLDGTQPFVGGAITKYLRNDLEEMHLDQACKH